MKFSKPIGFHSPQSFGESTDKKLVNAEKCNRTCFRNHAMTPYPPSPDEQISTRLLHCTVPFTLVTLLGMICERDSNPLTLPLASPVSCKIQQPNFPSWRVVLASVTFQLPSAWFF